MLTTIAKNRPMYDVLVLLLSYPEKRQTIEVDAKAPIVDEDTDEADNHSSVASPAGQAVGAAASHSLPVASARDSIDDSAAHVRVASHDDR